MSTPVSTTYPRKLRNCHNIEDLHRLARKALPGPIYDHVAGGSDDEVTLSDNERAYQKYYLMPRYCADIELEQVDMSTTVLGQKIDWPVLSSPWGGQIVIHRDGEIGLARAVHESGSAYCSSSWAGVSLEDVAAAAPGPKIFQLQPSRSREMMSDLMRRARNSGYSALILTVDNPLHGNRERDLRSGFGVPPAFTLKSLLSIAMRPRWAFDMLRLQPGFKNYEQYMDTPDKDMAWLAHQLVCGMDWDTVAWVAEQWQGPFAIKGILSVDDARLAVQAGVTGIIVSNQGARHFDYAPPTIDVLPEILDAVGDQVEVILDGGMRRGTDVLKGLALGAKACMTARPFAYGLAAGGQQGAARALELLKSEVQRDMVFLGAHDLSKITRACLRARDLSRAVASSSDATPPNSNTGGTGNVGSIIEQQDRGSLEATRHSAAGTA